MEGLESIAITLDGMDMVYYGIQSLSIPPYGNNLVWNEVVIEVCDYAHPVLEQTKNQLWKD